MKMKLRVNPDWLSNETLANAKKLRADTEAASQVLYCFGMSLANSSDGILLGRYLGDPHFYGHRVKRSYSGLFNLL